MKTLRHRITAATVSFGLLAASAQAEDWLRFRGPNGTGVAGTQNLPLDLSPEKADWQQEVVMVYCDKCMRESMLLLLFSESNQLLQ